MRYVAARLVACESKDEPASRKDAATALAVIEKLRPHLATLMGKAGFQALLSRALALAAREIPWMAGVQAKADGTLDDFGDGGETVTAAEMAMAGEVLLVRMLDLLVAFIGEILTIRLVREVWPRLPLDENFEKRDDHEKTN